MLELFLFQIDYHLLKNYYENPVSLKVNEDVDNRVIEQVNDQYL
jgi:hypothetical protein